MTTNQPHRTVVSQLIPGDHAAWFYRSPEEHRAGVTAFVRNALDGGGTVLYLADMVPVETVRGYLEDAQIDVDHALDSGRLRLLTFTDGYLKHGRFDLDRQVRLYEELLDQMTTQGHRSVWITGEGTWELRGGVPGAERFLEYERAVDRMFAREDTVVMCQYDATVIPEAEATSLRSVHNVELWEREVRNLGRRMPGLELVPTDEGMAVSGEVDTSTWAAFANAIRRLLLQQAGPGEILLDLQGLRFIDVRGFGLLVQAGRNLPSGRRLVLRGAPPMLMRMAEILDVDGLGYLVIEERDGGHGS